MLVNTLGENTSTHMHTHKHTPTTDSNASTDPRNYPVGFRFR